MATKTIVKKISLKTLGCDATVARDSRYKPGAVDADGKPLPTAGQRIDLAVIYGRANDTLTGESRIDDSIWTALLGSFEGVCLQVGPDFPTNMVFQSGRLFLPPVVHELVVGALKNCKDGDNVEFAFKLSAAWDEGKIGYRYFATSLIDAKPTDDLASVRQTVKANVPALELGPPPVAAVLALSPAAPAETAVVTPMPGETIARTVETAAPAKTRK